MLDPALISVIALQAVVALLGIVVLPWGGARLDAAVLSVRALRRRLRRLAEAAAGPASDPHRRSRRGASRPGSAEGRPGSAEGVSDGGSRTTGGDRIERRVRGLHALGAVTLAAPGLAPRVAVRGALGQRIAS